MTLHVEGKELVLPLTLVQGLHHVHKDNTRIEGSLNLRSQVVSMLDHSRR